MTVKNNTKPATTSDYQEIYDKESKQPYFKKILDLLSKYEDGWNVFIKAHELQRYDIPVPRKEEFQDDPYLPNSWMELSDAVLSIIAKEKFKLNTAENIIEIVRLDQMLDAYVRPIPGAPNHWTYGKKRIAEEKKYDYSKNIAYEIIINTNPCLAYYMENNSPTMQLLVNAHASQGHNAVYTNNRYFKRYTHASSIMAINERFRDTVEECNVKYGHDEVEKLLDFCQAMALMDTDDVPAKLKKTKAEMEAARLDAEEANYKVKRPKGIFDTNYSDDKTDDSKLDLSFPAKGKKNVLKFIADNSPLLPEWKRDIMRMSSDVSQHFRPNRETIVLNEGFACQTHFETMTLMFHIGLINFPMYTEFRTSHDNVTKQQSGITKIELDDGTIEEKMLDVNLNVYALGYAIFEDIKRICINPTEEDKRWFPQFAGIGEEEWMEFSVFVMENNNDETLIEQYLSPTVMRKFQLFAVEGKISDEFLTVSAVHADEGFEKIRKRLAIDHRIDDKLPAISIGDYNHESDRCLILEHKLINGNELDKVTASQILELIHSQTEFPCAIETVNEDGEVLSSFTSPPNYNYKVNKRIKPYPHRNVDLRLR